MRQGRRKASCDQKGREKSEAIRRCASGGIEGRGVSGVEIKTGRRMVGVEQKAKREREIRKIHIDITMCMMEY
jgi:hypothetical protein